MEIYRVRKSFEDIRSQKGAFLSFSAAIKTAKKHKMSVFGNEGLELYRAKKHRRKPHRLKLKSKE